MMSETLPIIRSRIPLRAHGIRNISELFMERGAVKFSVRHRKFNASFVDSPECIAGTARTIAIPRIMNYRKMANWATKNQTESIPDLSRAIVRERLDVTPAQFDDMFEAVENGRGILSTNKCTFAFAKTGKKLPDPLGEYDEVLVIWTFCLGHGGWVVLLDELGYVSGGNAEWSNEHELLLRNPS